MTFFWSGAQTKFLPRGPNFSSAPLTEGISFWGDVTLMQWSETLNANV